jgi:hypothetical protein
LAFLIFVLTPAYFLVDQGRQMPLRELSAIARTAEQPGEDLIVVGFKKPSVVFYTQRSVTYIRPTKEVMAHIEKLAARKAHPFTVLILVQQRKLDNLGLQPPQYKNLGKAGAYQLIRVFLS